MKILVLDNYDSFTYNLIHYVKELTNDPVSVYRNDKISLEAVGEYDKILLSPGPGIPKEAGILLDVIKTYAPTKSILGVCLGHQAIAEAFGGEIYNLPNVYHGVETKMKVLNPYEDLFKSIPVEFMAGRYHSWNVVKENLPDCLSITAQDEEGIIMGISHKTYDVRGLQFHPESVLTPYGKKMIENWLKTRNRVY